MLTNTYWLVSSSSGEAGWPCFNPLHNLRRHLSKGNIVSCHKHFTPTSYTKLFSGFSYQTSYIPQSLARSMGVHLARLACSLICQQPSTLLLSKLPVHPPVSLFTHFWALKVLLPACNILPILTIVDLVNTYPLLRTHSRCIFFVDAISDSNRWRQPHHSILYWAPQHTTQKHSPFFLSCSFYCLFPCLLVYSILTSNSQSHKSLIMNATKTTNQRNETQNQYWSFY